MHSKNVISKFKHTPKAKYADLNERPYRGRPADIVNDVKDK